MLIKTNTGTQIKQYAGITLAEELLLAKETGAQIMTGGAGFYTDRVDGVPPETDIRTDKFELLRNAKAGVDAERIAKRAEQAVTDKEDTKTDTNSEV